jgi:succinoglycan biosynthesis protein ExoA
MTSLIPTTVITPCRNEVRSIAAFLASVDALNRDGLDVEIVVADGMSDDGTRPLLDAWSKAEAGRIVVENLGRIVSTGLNAAIGIASGTFIVRMDAHTVYDKNYLVECVRALQQTNAKSVGGPWKAVGYDFVSRCIALAFQSPLGSGNSTSRKTDFSGYVDTVYLGSWRRQDLLDIGGFDEDLVRNQDEELCFRFRLDGGKIWQDAKIISSYAPRNSLLKLLKQSQQYGYWKVRVMRKHGRPANLRQFAPAALVAGGTLLVLLGIVSTLFWVLLAALALVYATACVLSMLGRGSSLAEVLVTALCIPIMHLGYGFGYWQGLWDFIILRRAPRPSSAKLTR